MGRDISGGPHFYCCGKVWDKLNCPGGIQRIANLCVFSFKGGRTGPNQAYFIYVLYVHGQESLTRTKLWSIFPPQTWQHTPRLEPVGPFCSISYLNGQSYIFKLTLCFHLSIQCWPCNNICNKIEVFFIVLQVEPARKKISTIKNHLGPSVPR